MMVIFFPSTPLCVYMIMQLHFLFEISFIQGGTSRTTLIRNNRFIFNEMLHWNILEFIILMNALFCIPKIWQILMWNISSFIHKPLICLKNDQELNYTVTQFFFIKFAEKNIKTLLWNSQNVVNTNCLIVFSSFLELWRSVNNICKLSSLTFG